MRRLMIDLPMGETDCEECPFRAIDWGGVMRDESGYLCTNPAWANPPDHRDGTRHQLCLEADGGPA